MRGRLIELDREQKIGVVDPGTDGLRDITIYFDNVPESLHEEDTVEFELRVSAKGNRYAKYCKTINRNQSIFSTENRMAWYVWGSNEEIDFINKVAPKLDKQLAINPEKKDNPSAIDLIYVGTGQYADLKTQNTPFFTAGRYEYKNKPYNPEYTVTFNRKDYENYKNNYPDCDIYYWVNWTQLEYRDISVSHIYGVWRAKFSKMAEYIESKTVVLHSYLNRKNDNHNARDSYLFSLNDTDVFEHLL